MNETELLEKQYKECLDRQTFQEKDLDYSALEKYKPVLKQLSLLGISGISVFDLCKKENIFDAYNLTGLFGYDLTDERSGTAFFNSRIHTEDFSVLLKNVITYMEFLFGLPKEERADYKLISEYRVLDSREKYVRVLEQYQSLEGDKHGHVWLCLRLVDVSPEQEGQEVKSQIFSFRSGKYFLLNGQAIPDKNNFSGKETVSSLSISVHKANANRKRLLEKLNAENAGDVSKRIVKYGLLD